MIRFRILQCCLLFLSLAGGAFCAAQGPGVAVLQQLREKNVEGALESLGSLADAGLYWTKDESDAVPAALGGLFRSLSQLSETEQYDLLRQWSLPTASRRSVRILTSPVPRDAPPAIFARVLRERPRDSSFPVSSINGIPGLFSTGWTLVTLADQLGRLDRLTAELEDLHRQTIPDADVLLLLAKLKQRQVDHAVLGKVLVAAIERVSRTHPEGLAHEQVLHPSIMALGAAALSHDELASLGESVLRELRDKANRLAAYRLRAYLRAMHAVAVLRAHGKSDPGLLSETRFKYWVPVSLDLAHTSAEGTAGGAWIAQEDHILHLAGAYNDILFFRYPLAGDFEFAAEVQATSGPVSDTSLAHGGLFFQSLGRSRDLTVWDADMSTIAKKPCPFAREESATSFNRVSLRSSSGRSEYLINRHPMWFDGDEAAASPFIGFRYYGNHQSLVRNFELTGDPVIPREVALSSGTQLRGWQSRYFSESKRSAHANLNAAANYDWFAESGEIRARRRDDDPRRQSLLRYQRPLLAGEAIKYEFFYVPDESEVHPALGRLAFLIEPGGVRIHWITDGEREWSTLPEDNATFEPLNRRGPRPLPLRTEDWNSVGLSRTNDKLTLELNGETIYEREIDFPGDTTFGLFRDPSRTSVRVRGVILSGDWPETVPAEFVQDPTAVADPQRQHEARAALQSLIGPDRLAANINAVRRRAAELPLEERYRFLADWVLPNDMHPDIRMMGEFTPTSPSPLAIELEPHRFFDEAGAGLVSPVFDLFNTAVELDRIEELLQHIEGIPDTSDLEQRRSKRALQVILALERNDRARASALADQLQLLLHESFREKWKDYWPELHLITRALRRHEAAQVIVGLITDLFQQRFSLGIEIVDKKQILALMRECQAQLYVLPAPRDATLSSVKHWIPVTRAIAKSRGTGSPNLVWTVDSERMLVIGAGHDDDFLFYRSPLIGDYEVNTKTQRYGASFLMTGGRFVGAEGNGLQAKAGTFRRPGESEKIDYPFMKHDKTVDYRATVEQGRVRMLLNGHPISEHRSDDPLDPWVALRGVSYSDTAFHHVQIVGNPTIPDEIPMTAADDLSCWVPYYLGMEDMDWKRVEDEQGRGTIHSDHRPELAGSHFESLLRYHRPLVEDGSVEYEFLYSPERYTAHPALDRLVFLLEPDGVRIHWLTDGRYDPTRVPPDNAIEEPENRRGPAHLPFNFNNWNRVKVSLKGSRVSLELNGVLVYERDLEPTNQRTFGLFHYADRTELLVRNPVMRGDWPRTLPPLHEQELADPKVAEADRNLEKLDKVFHHDFDIGGLPLEYFTFVGSNPGERQVVVPGGVRATMTDAVDYQAVGMVPRFTLSGDFDVRARIDELDLADSGVEGGALLDLKLGDDQQHYLRTVRVRREDTGDTFQATISPLHPNGRRSYLGLKVSDVSTSGTLRIARIGARIIFMYAPDDSTAFRAIREETISDADVLMHGIQLKTSLRDGRRSSILWKYVTIRAEGMKYLAPQDETQLKHLAIMNADGSNVRQVMGLLPGMTGLGSPEFSADGTQIALDMSQGSVASSRIIVVNTDGTGVRDLGPGCMPSFSPDGKKIALTQSGAGIVLMDSDGSNREIVDSRGWGVQFSPDGQFIAYGKSGNITLRNQRTGETRELLAGAAATRYSYTYWNLGWSHDSKSIAFKGRLRQSGEDEVAVVNVDRPESFQVLDSDAAGVNPDFTFTPDNQGVLYSKNDPQLQGPQLYLVHRKTPGELEPLKGQPADRKILNCVWSPDGKQIAFTANLNPEPVEWTQTPIIESPSNDEK